MKFMVRFIVLVLIALLPLRGWSVAIMSVNKAAAETVVVASSEHAVHEAMPDDCPMLSHLSGADQDHTTAQSHHAEDNSHQGCQSCQLCMSLVTQDVRTIALPKPAPLSAALAPTSCYASADLPQAVKPPIS